MGIVDAEQDAARAELRSATAQIRAAQNRRMNAVHRCRTARLTITEIANLTGVHRETVYRWIKDDQSGPAAGKLSGPPGHLCGEPECPYGPIECAYECGMRESANH